MYYGAMYNILQEISQNGKLRSSIEDLYLCLREIDYLIHNNKENIDGRDKHNEFKYKLQVIAQQTAEVGKRLRENNKVEIDYNEYLA